MVSISEEKQEIEVSVSATVFPGSYCRTELAGVGQIISAVEVSHRGKAGLDSIF